MYDQQPPTVEELRHHFVDEEGWDDIEVADLLEHYPFLVNADGTTNASLAEWQRLADDEPQGN